MIILDMLLAFFGLILVYIAYRAIYLILIPMDVILEEGDKVELRWSTQNGAMYYPKGTIGIVKEVMDRGYDSDGNKFEDLITVNFPSMFTIEMDESFHASDLILKKVNSEKKMTQSAIWVGKSALRKNFK